MQPVATLKEETIMVPIINLMIQLERDPERAIRQAEILARHKSADRRSGKHTWFSQITTALTTHLIRIFGSGHGRIERKRACCHNSTMSNY